MSYTRKEVTVTLKVIFDSNASLENPSTTVSHSVPKSLHPVAQILGSGMACSWDQAGIKIAGRIINNLRYADDTTLMAQSEEELRAS